ncbi:hypothetical protein EFL95_00310 [Nocardioides marmorisolisilvae]|uniref:Uncharacterized protein n=1 Tax=Nocardioides marmorisolisilvae TaxID=1542737 RepID=A0A3N0DZ31_9ACTN|nr:hypothetical protein EFL95_00310 [Nocardioides marmorisolisilvae]
MVTGRYEDLGPHAACHRMASAPDGVRRDTLGIPLVVVASMEMDPVERSCPITDPDGEDDA